MGTLYHPVTERPLTKQKIRIHKSNCCGSLSLPLHLIHALGGVQPVVLDRNVKRLYVI